MDNTNIGRGAFLYVLALIIINPIIIFLLHIFVGIDKIMASEGWDKIFALGACLFVFEQLVFVFWNSILMKGWRRSLLGFGIAFIVAFTAEALGVNFGLVFGSYHYSKILGPQIVGVPFLVALAWEPILYSSYCMSDILVPSKISKADPFIKRASLYLGLALVGAFATTVWDMMVDPMAVSNGWWIWHDGGPYVSDIESGVPITNFMGWLFVAFICQISYRIIMNTGVKPPQRSANLSIYGPLSLYILLFIMSEYSSIVITKRLDVALIGLMCMGSLIIVALAKVNLFHKKSESTYDEQGLE